MHCSIQGSSTSEARCLLPPCLYSVAQVSTVLSRNNRNVYILSLVKELLPTPLRLEGIAPLRSLNFRLAKPWEEILAFYGFIHSFADGVSCLGGFSSQTITLEFSVLRTFAFVLRNPSKVIYTHNFLNVLMMQKRTSKHRCEHDILRAYPRAVCWRLTTFQGNKLFLSLDSY